jgi:oligopeptide/dipeptide ABC transporter ATP-binding protein
MIAPLLSMRGIAVEIGGREALTDVHLDVPAAGCVGVVGETGSGKSLTCRVILGLLDRIHGRVTRGSAELDGEDLLSRTPEQWRRLRGRRIALVPQSSSAALDPVMRIGRQLREAVHVIDPGADPQQRSLELLEQVQMARARDVLGSYAHELSGGMRQRVTIALALAGRPALLVADEPTTALDVTVQRSLLELLDQLRRDTGMALILVTHDLAVVRAVADDVVVMYAGMTVEAGPVDTIFAQPGHPYTRALLSATPGKARHGQRLVPIPGAPPSLDERPAGCPFAPRCPHVADACRAGQLTLEQVGSDHRVACKRVAELVA